MSFSLRLVAAPPAKLRPVFAALYGAEAGELAWMTDTLSAAWVAVNGVGEALGAVGLRQSPAHGAEVMGGAVYGPEQRAVAAALAQVAREAGGRVYAFANEGLLPRAALDAAGYLEVGAYRMLAGPTPTPAAEAPAGVRLLPLADVPDVATRLDALSTYEDRIGHHRVVAAAAGEGAGGFDDRLSLIALNESGEGVGICRAAPEDLYARIDAPGVRPDYRHTGLRAALLLGVCALVRARGLEHVSLESWGDTPEELAHDLGLGLDVELEDPICAAG